MRRTVPRAVREATVYLVAGTLSRAVSVLLLPLYARALDDTELGAFGVLTALLLLLQILTIGGFDSAAGRWYFHVPTADERERTFATWATNQLVLSAGVALVMAGAAEPIAAVLTGDADRFAGAVRIAGLIPLTGALPNILYNWYRLARRPGAAGGTATVIAVTTVAMTFFAMVVLDAGVEGAFAAQAVAGASISVVAVVLMGRAARPTSASWHRWREMLRFALPLVPAGAAFWAVNVADRFLLRALASVDEAGRYHVVATISSGIALLTQAFQQTWGPMALSIKDQPRAREVYRVALVGYAALGGLLTVAVAAIGDVVLWIVFGADSASLLPALVILTASVAANGVLAIAMVGPTIAGTSRPTLEAVIVAALVNTVANLALIPRLGATGAAWATLLAMATLAVVALIRSERTWRVGYPTQTTVVVVAVSAGLAGAQCLVSLHTAGVTRVLASIVLLGVGGALAVLLVVPRLRRIRS